MANLNLNFYNKNGNPLNFDYIGATGPTPLDTKFSHILGASASTQGYFQWSETTDDYSLVFNIADVNNTNLYKWCLEVNDFISKGATVYLNGYIAIANTNFKGKITSVSNIGSTFTITLPKSYFLGQNIISYDTQIYFEGTYDNRPGGYFKGNIYFDPISTGLYENQQIFVVQEFLNGSGDVEHGLPHTSNIGLTGARWRTRWYNNNYGDVDVSEIIFTYAIEDQLSGGDGQPLIISYPNMVIPVGSSVGDSYSNGLIVTSNIQSDAIAINVALNSPDDLDNIYERKLIVEDITTDTPQKVIEIDFYGQTVAEDERFKVLLENIGRSFYNSDSIILRDHDPAEPVPNFMEINEKRKELLIAGEEIFPYIGSYKGLINALKFFGYQDMRIKEYWLNLNYKNLKLESPLQQNQTFLNKIKSGESKNGYSQSYNIGDVLDNENSGKYKLIQTYGPDGDGNYVLNVTSENTQLPSKSIKKTSLFGLYYDLNKVTSDTDEYGYPIVTDAFKFTQEEILIKIFALKERLKRDYLPLNARIIDITGEGVYFMIQNTKSWTDQMIRSDINIGYDFDFFPNPDFGFIEDLRNFNIRPNSNYIQTPSSYDNSYSLDVSFPGGTGSAIRFSGTIPYGITGDNPTIKLEAGKTYNFEVNDSSGYGLNFNITNYAGFPSNQQLWNSNVPTGIINNGATDGNSLEWYIAPGATGTIHYYSSNNPVSLSGSVEIIPATLSDLGNIVNPLDFQQNYTPVQNESLLLAIDKFYNLKQNGKIVELGDDRFDSPEYIDPLTGVPYETPVGMPVILELSADRWEWNELNIDWDALLIPTYRPGDRVKIKSTGIFGTVRVVYYSTGEYEIALDNSTTAIFGETELFSTVQNYTILNWKNVDFSNMVEIEWLLNKSATQPGTPYNFAFRGSIVDYYKLAHFLPYTGEYQVICNTYDAFNTKTTVIKNASIFVDPKTIDIDSWTRYREVENYLWDNVDREWKEYESIWEYPAEGSTIDTLRKTIPSEILDFATYGNKADDGQDLLVKTTEPPTGAYGTIVLNQEILVVSSIVSNQITIGQYGSAVVTTTTPHSLQNGDNATLTGSISQLNGRWPVTVTGASSFYIPVTLSYTWPGVLLQATPTNYLYVDTSVYASQEILSIGTISIYVNNRLIGNSKTGDSLYNTANEITSSINSLRTYPDYFASCENPQENPVTITIYAPGELGAEQNGVPLRVEEDGSVNVISYSPVLSGGVNPSDYYVYWDENGENYPNPNLKYWGTKRLNWQIFNDSTWDNGYAHSWYDYEFNNDWLGGYELHSVIANDKLRISTGNETYPFPETLTFRNSGGTLTLSEAASQLNSADSHITNFYYRVIPDDAGSLLTINGPINVDMGNSVLNAGPYPAPPSLIGGSELLVVEFGYTGGTTSTTTIFTDCTFSGGTAVVVPASTTSTTTSTSSTTSTTTSTSSTTTTTTTICADCIDGNIQIGTQAWSLCNLNVTNYANGEIITEVQDPSIWAGLTGGAWCHYGNNPANEATYGKLYNWYAVKDPRGLAPAGYHIPTNTEWTTLTNYVSSIVPAGNPGGKMKETGFCHWNPPNTDATNASGFTGIPGGSRNVAGAFNSIGDFGFWWSSTENGSDTALAYSRGLYTDGNFVIAQSNNKPIGFSVRLIYDGTPTTTSTTTTTTLGPTYGYVGSLYDCVTCADVSLGIGISNIELLTVGKWYTYTYPNGGAQYKILIISYEGTSPGVPNTIIYDVNKKDTCAEVVCSSTPSTTTSTTTTSTTTTTTAAPTTTSTTTTTTAAPTTTTSTTTTTAAPTTTTSTTTTLSWPSALFSFYYATGGINNWEIYGYGNQSSPINILSGGQNFGSLAVKTDPAFNNYEVVTFHWYGETWAGPGYIDTLVTLTIKGATSEPTGWSNVTVNHAGTITTLPRIGPNTVVQIYNEQDGFGIYNDYVTWTWSNVTPIPFGYEWSVTVDVN